MKFDGSSLELRPNDITPNSRQRQLYKSMMNSVIGKFAQKSNFPQTQYVSNAEDIDNLFKTGETIVDFQTIADDICAVQTTSPVLKDKKNRKTNPIITAFVTSLSRIDMHENILRLEKSHCCPLYTDTDSLIFTIPTGQPLPFELNIGLGSFKPEYELITGFCCIGKKSYAINKGLTETETEAKVCGLSFVSRSTESAVSFDDFENFLQKQIPLKKVQQTRTFKSTNPFSIKKSVTEIEIASKLNYSRVLRTRDRKLYTTPYGYLEIPRSEK